MKRGGVGHRVYDIQHVEEMAGDKNSKMSNKR